VGPSTPLFTRYARDQVRGNFGRISADPLDELDIPKVMQVTRLKSGCRHLLSIPARIVIVSSVKGLMHVADKVQEEFEREPPFNPRC